MDYKASVITVSTRAYRGEYEDKSGRVLEMLLNEFGFKDVEKVIVSDDKKMLKKQLLRFCKKYQLIITTGGTGVAGSDITPDVCLKISDRIVPGIAEEIRNKSVKEAPNALLSRAVCVIRKKTLIINFPGNPNACRQCFEIVKPVLLHALGLINGKKMDG